MTERGPAIVLIGFSGSGKSSVGRELEARTGRPRYDIDEMIRRERGRSIAEIFDQEGEESFRDAETAVLRDIPADNGIVVTGGGILVREENGETLRRLGRIVHLTAAEETLFERVSRRPTRPLLRTANPRRTLAELLQVRAPLYRRLADWELDTTSLTHQQAAEAILEQIDDDGGDKRTTR